MPKLKISPTLLREKATSKAGREYADELEKINWEIQELIFKTHCVQLKYKLKNFEYLDYLGYELTEEDIKEKQSIEEEIKNYGETL